MMLLRKSELTLTLCVGVTFMVGVGRLAVVIFGVAVMVKVGASGGASCVTMGFFCGASLMYTWPPLRSLDELRQPVSKACA